MRIVRMLAVVDPEKCTGCTICDRVCPTLAIQTDRKAHLAAVEADRCSGCPACEQRCPEGAISLSVRQRPFELEVKVPPQDRARVHEICRTARFHPEQTICFCTGTRADELAAAILQGAHTPEELSARTGVRTGCTVECHQPILRLLEAAGVKPVPPKGGWQWYGRTVTAWEIPEETKRKYSGRGFYFDDDIAILDRVADAPLQDE
jgi:Pyruvate/2-oxoacid:ferredoxin oxidoreductase delta subunit/bacterioferritin-associated ferredoxin